MSPYMKKNHCIKRYVNSFGSQISIDRLRNQYNEKKLENRMKKDEILKAKPLFFKQPSKSFNTFRHFQNNLITDK